MQAHTNSFIVLCDGVKSDFMACARQSDLELVNLTPGRVVGPAALPVRVSTRFKSLSKMLRRVQNEKFTF